MKQSSDGTELLRAFIALELTPGARRVAAALQDELRRASANIRWVEPANLHVTLKFLGDAKPAVLDRLADRLRESLQGVHRVPLTVAGAGAFPGASQPRVVWAGVREHEEIGRLYSLVETAAVTCGFPPERRPFRAHLTLGRVKSPGDLSIALGEQALREYRSETELAHSVTLFQSELTHRGAVYSARYEVELV
ncbi:MAG: 2'-5' RNA ligase [Armatimonadetes bacterium CG2_30_66_41]|nr:RNA 2',3'-cyclic phosphodiesterase [Armatimonadota bacterium]OIP04517.1 MAG: 2'-5' RNA ligase [Armatimonadetes bacterium CG2_30_66_41]NCO92735.1 RNA 2',3'-cyclic phosphodiesterase [Armatimonadota bacterium]NCP30056.1 RNA 2',3'-cyclic phosphodiesterase [Armatimonadota bacterium]NCQ26640.1 RNA 2',3'-cyclic phosphodiesterase [Armatimonadota bacterium]